MEGREGGNVKGLTKGFPLIAAAVLLFPAAQAAKLPGLEMLPDETRYIECLNVGCTFEALEVRMVADVKTRTDGYYTYVLGNVELGQVRTYSIEWQRAHMDRETWTYTPQVLDYFVMANPAGFATDFVGYSSYLKEPPSAVRIPPSVVGSMPTDVGQLGAVSAYLSGLSQFNGIFIGTSRVIVPVEFANGDTAKFVLAEPFGSLGIRFKYLVGTAYDAEGQPIAINDTNSTNSASNSGGTGITGVGSTGGAANSSVTVYGPVVNLNGAVRVSEITVGGGEGEGPERTIVCVDSICVGT
jgi:hypothetical protein